jgi:ATP-dependent protease ClpP protease subunit
MDKAIRFMAPVNAETSDLLFKVIDELVNQGMTRLHLLLSTPGGSVFHGLSIHNYLRGLPIPVVTYNFGSVDSIGVVIYCAGMQRFTVPHSRFLIHSVKFNINGKVSLDEKQIEEYLKGVKIDQRNIARVMADTTGRSVDVIEQEMIDRTTLNPEEAVAYGLVHAVKKELIPAGTEMMAIGEPIPNQPYQARKVRFQ